MSPFMSPTWGPNFNTKCILGINKIIDYRDDALVLNQINSSYGHFRGYLLNGPSRNQISIQMICLGFEY